MELIFDYIRLFSLCSDDQKMRIVSNLAKDINKKFLDGIAQHCNDDQLKILSNGSFQERINQSKGQNMSSGKQF